MIAEPHNREGEAFASLSRASKFYGEFAALKDVSIDLVPGEVHMLLGENGAGKSTLVSLLTGVNALDEGERRIRGKSTPVLTPTESRKAGINAVLQDFSLSPALTVEENFVLAREPRKGIFLDRAEARRLTQAALDQIGLSVSPKQRVGTISRAEQQMLEIARALGGEPGLIILDEPTSALSHEETERLFNVLRSLRDDGWALLYISHRMDEIRQLGDVVTILRDGRLTGHYRIADVTNEQMVADMVGRDIGSFYPDIPHHPDSLVLETDSLSSDGRFSHVSIELKRGEIVGIGGLVGCGKGDLARALFGLLPIDKGSFVLDGEPVADLAPVEMLDRGLVYLPQDRGGEALALNRSISDNIVLEILDSEESKWLGFIRQQHLNHIVDSLLQRLNVQPPRPKKIVGELSGGNQQKVVLGRALSKARKVIVCDEPTSGIDVGARAEFYRQLAHVCEEGAAVLLVTSDLQELINVSHRIYVMSEGRVVAHLARDEITEEKVVAYAFGEEVQKETD